MVKRPLSLKSFVVGALRRASYRWRPRNEALRDARVARGEYLCRLCQKVSRRKEIRLDHIQPVIDPAVGFTGWDEYVKRMFPEKDGFQALCNPCHDAKTLSETKRRKRPKKRKRK